jgi:hypothetical protein
MAAQLVHLASRADPDIDVSLLSPLALASTLEIPLVTTNQDLADVAVGLLTVTLLPTRLDRPPRYGELLRRGGACLCCLVRRYDAL